MKRKLWHCKVCDSTQEYSQTDVICRNCGMDLSMGPGEVVFKEDGASNIADDDADIFFGDDEEPEAPRRERKKKTIWPFVAIPAVLVFALAAVLLVLKPWQKSGSENPLLSVTDGQVTEELTEAPTQEPTEAPTEVPTEPSVPAVVPDLQFFAGKQAKPVMSSVGEQTQEQQYDLSSEEAAKTILSEYRQLLEEQYPYKQVDTYTIKDDDGKTREGYCYQYTGSDDVEGYSIVLNDGKTTKGNHITLVLREKEDAWNISMVFSKELVFEFSEERTTYDEPDSLNEVGSIPDMHSFADQNASWANGNYGDGYFWCYYRVPAESVGQAILAEYRQVLQKEYPFALTEEYTINEQTSYESYAYEYTGSGHVETISVNLGEETSVSGVHFVVSLVEKEGSYFLQLIYSNELYPELNKWKTTLQNTNEAKYPDIEVFLGSYGEVQSLPVEDSAMQYTISGLTLEAARAIMEEYGELLTGEYPYDDVEYHEQTVDEYQQINRGYRYTGTKQVHGMKITGRKFLHHIRLTLWESEDEIFLTVLVSKDLEKEDKGVQTTYQPEP